MSEKINLVFIEQKPSKERRKDIGEDLKKAREYFNKIKVNNAKNGDRETYNLICKVIKELDLVRIGMKFGTESKPKREDTLSEEDKKKIVGRIEVESGKRYMINGMDYMF